MEAALRGALKLTHIILALAVACLIAAGAYWPAAVLGSAVAVSLIEWKKNT